LRAIRFQPAPENFLVVEFACMANDPEQRLLQCILGRVFVAARHDEQKSIEPIENRARETHGTHHRRPPRAGA